MKMDTELNSISDTPETGNIFSTEPPNSQLVLIVEDEAPVANLEKAILERSGYRAELCVSGREALDRLAKGGVAIVLLDYQLPDMKGDELIRQLGDRIATLPVVVITGHGDERLAADLIKQGAADYLVKGVPNFVHILTSTVKSAVDRFRMVAEKRILAVQLVESAETFRNTFAAIPDPAFMWNVGTDGETLLAQVNPAGGELSRARFPTPVGLPIRQFFRLEPGIVANVLRAMTEGEPIREERFGAIFTDGDRWYSLAYARFKKGGVLLIATDITDRKKAEQALRESRAVLEQCVAEQTAELSAANRQLRLEVAERQRAGETLKRHLTMEGVIAAMSSRSVSADDLGEVVNDAIAHLGRAASASRAFMFRFRDSRKAMQCNYEYLEDSATARGGELSDAPTEPILWLLQRLRNGEMVSIPDVANWSPPEGGHPELLPSRDALAFAAFPIYVDGQLTGMVCYESLHKTYIWSDEDLLLLKTAAEIIGTALEARESRRRVEESEAKYRNLVERAHDGIAIVQDEKIVYANPRLYGITGHTEGELEGGAFSDIIHPDEQERVLDFYRKRIAGKAAPEVYETILSHKNGAKIEVELTAGIVAFLGRPADLLIVRDVAERKRLELQLHHAQKMESIGTLAAGIAHEINTPTQFVGDNLQFLGTAFADIERLIAGYQELVQAIKTGADPSGLISEIDKRASSTDLDYLREEIPRALAQSKDGVKRVADIVRAMKAFAHPGPEVKTPVDINNAILNTITVARNEWKYVAEMETDLDPTLPLVTCLPGDINQVVLNIIVNASHAIAEVVGDGQRAKGVIRVATHSEGDMVLIRVSDTGKGIPAAIRSRIFDPFFTTKEVGKGTGQGLAIAHNVVVEKHKGTIGFETEEGKGTTFIIRLPLDAPKAQA